MARIILHWLNEEVRLSQEITSLSEDFRNGYLLGELLFKYNQQHHFNKFLDRDTPDAKIANFCLLEPTMRQIGVHFNSKVAYDVMNAKPGATKTLLYEIRTVLEAAKNMSKSADSHQMKHVMQIIKPSIPLYDQTMSATFENAIRSMVDNPNDLLMERATNKFSRMTNTFHQSVSDSYSKQMSETKYELQRTKAIEREKHQHEKEFQHTWDQMNKDQWKKNQIRARNRRNLQQTVAGNAIRKQTAKSILENTSARDKAISSIDDFEERMADMKKRDDNVDNSLLALKTVGSQDDGSGIPSLTYLDEGTLHAGMIQNQREMQDRNDKLLQRQQERDRRRKRYVRLKESDQAATLQMEAEGEIFTRVLTTSELEEVEKLAKLRIMVYKDLFVQNYQTRGDLLVARRKEYQEYLNRCIEYDADVELSCVVTNRVLAQVAKLDALEEAKLAAYNQESTETAWREIDRILDITDWIVNMRAVGDYRGGIELTSTEEEGTEVPTLLPKALMSDVNCMYVSEDVSVPAAFPVSKCINVYEDFPLSLSWKPPCPETDWLLDKPFRGVDFMTDARAAVVSSSEEEKSTTEEAFNASAATSSAAAVEVIAEETAEGETEEKGDRTGETVISEAVTPGGAANGETEEPSISPPLPPSADIIAPSRMSHHLTCVDSDNFISSISAFEPIPEDPEAADTKSKKAPPPKKETAKKGKNDVEEVESGIKVIPPAWVGQTPSSSVVGEVVVATRCVADPIPPHPTAPEHIPVFPLRIVLCGPTYAMRRSVADALASEFNVALLRVDDLVSAAIAEGEKLALNADDTPQTSLQSLSLSVYGMCQRGSAVDDDSYVSLLVEAVSALDPESAGYVIEDFPNTKDQASKLVIALSGVDYNQRMPQTSDKISPFLTSVPRSQELFDASKCGLDKAFFITAPAGAIAKNRICLRKDLRTGEIVSMSESVKSVETLAEIVTPRNAMDTISLQVATSSHAAHPLREFMNYLGVSFDAESTDGATESVVECVVSNVRQLVESRTPAKEEEEVSSESEQQEEETEAAPNAEREVDAPPSEGDAPLSGETSLPPVVLQEGILPPRLAKILADVWQSSENKTNTVSQQFFSSMREIHYQMVQRRGAVRQIAVTQMLVRDEKQNLLDTFREDFNSFEEDFRFDAELMNELYLRTLELRDSFWEISENKAKSAKAVVHKVSLDGMANVLIHNAQCVGASLLQSYVGLFVAGLNVLFDYMRSTSSYNFTSAYGQVLEAIAPATNPLLQAEEAAGGAKGKEKDKKKGAGEVRSPLAPPVLWSEMEELPPSKADEEEAGDDKGKKKDAKKDKKKDEAASGDPQSAATQNALSFCDSWSRAQFAVDRAVYGGDEELASAIEKAVWHEADRLRKVIEMVTDFVQAQSQWITTQETDILAQTNVFIEERLAVELSVSERLTAMINSCIEQNSPIREQWQIAADKIVVRKERLVYPPPAPAIVPEINEFQPSHLNGEQTEYAIKMLDSLQLGGKLLKEDLLQWVNLCESGLGPYGHCFGNDGEVHNLVLPKIWRNDHEDLVAKLYSPEPVPGTKETTGVVELSTVLQNMEAYGRERFEVLNKWTGSL